MMRAWPGAGCFPPPSRIREPWRWYWAAVPPLDGILGDGEGSLGVLEEWATLLCGLLLLLPADAGAGSTGLLWAPALVFLLRMARPRRSRVGVESAVVRATLCRAQVPQPQRSPSGLRGKLFHFKSQSAHLCGVGRTSGQCARHIWAQTRGVGTLGACTPA